MIHETCLVTDTSQVRTLDLKLPITTLVLSVFHQFVTANAIAAPLSKPQPLYFTLFTNHPTIRS